MSPMNMLGNQSVETNNPTPASTALPLALPTGSLLAKYLLSRVREEDAGQPPVRYKTNLRHDLKPFLPKAGQNAMWLYSHRRAVQDYSMLFLTMALVNPN